MSHTCHRTRSPCLSNTMPDVLCYATMSIKMFKEIRLRFSRTSRSFTCTKLQTTHTSGEGHFLGDAVVRTHASLINKGLYALNKQVPATCLGGTLREKTIKQQLAEPYFRQTSLNLAA